MQFGECRSQICDTVCSCFDQKEVFLLVLDGTLPAIDGTDRANDVYAGREAALDQRVRQLLGSLVQSDGGKNDA